MEQVRIVKLKLNTTPEIFLPVIAAFTKAYNYCCQISWKDNDTNGVSLHHKTYRTCRTYLTADLTCSARTKAIESVKAVKALQKEENKRAKQDKRNSKVFSCPVSQQNSIRYNDKTFTISFDKQLVSLQTLEGRVKVSFQMLPYFKKYLTWKRCSAELFIRDEQVYLHVSFSKDILPVNSNNKYIGIDRGQKKLAVTSDNLFFGGSHVKTVSTRFNRLRSQLQAKKHSGKRHLVKLKHKENRFRRDVNHVISKKIVSTLNAGTTIVLEDLTDLRERTILKCKKRNRREKSSWSYFQLEQFLRYKAAEKHIFVVEVDARYTSKCCSCCGHTAKNNRTKQSIFKCRKCGFSINADLNAARNIRQKHLDAISCRKRLEDAIQVGSINGPDAVLRTDARLLGLPRSLSNPLGLS